MSTTMTSNGFTFGDGATLETAAPDKTQVGGHAIGLYNGTVTTPANYAPNGNYFTSIAPGTTGINFVRDPYVTYTLNSATQTSYLTGDGGCLRRAPPTAAWSTAYGIPASGTSLSLSFYFLPGSYMNLVYLGTLNYTTVSSGSYRSVSGAGTWVNIADPTGYGKAVQAVQHSGGIWQRYA